MAVEKQPGKQNEVARYDRVEQMLDLYDLIETGSRIKHIAMITPEHHITKDQNSYKRQQRQIGFQGVVPQTNKTVQQQQRENNAHRCYDVGQQQQ